jgi:hypothetical protein
MTSGYGDDCLHHHPAAKNTCAEASSHQYIFLTLYSISVNQKSGINSKMHYWLIMECISDFLCGKFLLFSKKYFHQEEKLIKISYYMMGCFRKL